MWVRIKKPNMEMEILVLELADIDSFTIDQDEEDKFYYLTCFKGNAIISVHVGTFSDCHDILNKIIKKLKIKLIDL